MSGTIEKPTEAAKTFQKVFKPALTVAGNAAMTLVDDSKKRSRKLIYKMFNEAATTELSKLKDKINAQKSTVAKILALEVNCSEKTQKKGALLTYEVWINVEGFKRTFSITAGVESWERTAMTPV